MADATLALTLHRLPDGALQAGATFTPAGGGAVPQPLAANIPLALDLRALRASGGDPATYGQALTAQLFADPRMRQAWQRARDAGGAHLRVLLQLDPADPELHSLRWETLRDPLHPAGLPLAQNERVTLVRLLPTRDLAPVTPAARPVLRALLVVSGPTDLHPEQFAEVDVAGEVARLQQALGAIPCTVLADHPLAQGRRATRAHLAAELGQGYPLVIIIAHGVARAGSTDLWLEQDDGSANLLAGGDLVNLLSAPTRRPLLVTLCACQSAGRGYGDGLAALGPQLAQAGIPAVVAFQGPIAIRSAQAMLPALFTRLADDGRVDAAIAAARRATDDRGWWQAVLWAAVSDGRLWIEADDGRGDPLAAALALLGAVPLEAIPAPAPLPPGSRTPYRRNPLFVGRTDDLRALARALAGGASSAIGQVAVATGLGGIGKTNLATEFVHRYGPFFAGGVCWVSFADPAAIPAEVAACGAAMDLPGFAELKLDGQVARVRAAWAQPIPRLLVFDNCDDTETTSAEELLAAWCPPSGGARVLVTSRRGVWDATLGVTPCPLGVLARLESVALLRQLRRDLGAADADTIAATLGDLPLALQLAGSFLAAYPSVTPAAYLRELAAALLAHPSLEGRGAGRLPTDHERHVARTFALSYDRLRADDPTDGTARALLLRAACLAPGEPIPRDLLLATVTTDGVDELLSEDGLRRLVALGLLVVAEGGAVTLHRLLVEFVQRLGIDAAARGAVERATSAWIQRTVEHSGAYYWTLRPLDGHLRHVGAGALTGAGPHLARLCAQVGAYLQWTDDYDLALRYLAHARAGYRAGGDRRGEADTLRVTGEVQWLRDNHPAALAAYRQALTLYTALGERLGVANTLVSIGEVQGLRGNHAGALGAYQQALTLYTALGKRLGAATALKSIGEVQQVHGEYAAALSSYQQALTIYEAVGERRGEASTLVAIGEIQRVRADHDSALRSYRQALTIYEAVGDHRGTARTLLSIGHVQRVRADHDGALSSYQQALTIYEAVGSRLGTANALKSIGEIQRVRADHDSALASYQQALAIYEAIGDRRGIATTLLAIGSVQQLRADHDSALTSYQQALAGFRGLSDRLGEAYVVAAQSLLLIDRDPDESRALLQQAIAIQESLAAYYNIGADLGNYGRALLQRGRGEEALVYLRRARTLFAEHSMHEMLPQTDRLIAQAAQQVTDRGNL